MHFKKNMVWSSCLESSYRAEKFTMLLAFRCNLQYRFTNGQFMLIFTRELESLGQTERRAKLHADCAVLRNLCKNGWLLQLAPWRDPQKTKAKLKLGTFFKQKLEQKMLWNGEKTSKSVPERKKSQHLMAISREMRCNYSYSWNSVKKDKLQ